MSYWSRRLVPILVTILTAMFIVFLIHQYLSCYSVYKVGAIWIIQ